MDKGSMFLTDMDEKKFNEWSKEDIFKAYLIEVEVRQALNIQVNKLNRRLAEVKYLCQQTGEG